MKLQRIQSIKYLGTIESFNEIVKKYFDKPHIQVAFFDLDRGETVNYFTGGFIVFDHSRDKEKDLNSNVIFKSGDCLQFRVTEEDMGI